MPQPHVTVAVPTLSAGAVLEECLASLAAQTWRSFEVIVIDNSGCGRAQLVNLHGARVIANRENVGFGTAINQAAQASSGAYVATLNDDAIAEPEWLERLVEAAEREPRVGMIAAQVRLSPEGVLDSAGMRIASDGTSKQRGHGEPPSHFAEADEVLCPSGSSALYRRAMLEQLGGFDDRFFLYCEDTDLGLRARRLGWTAKYLPGAVVHHR
ncbi:MAG TPA: glycosyltransferase family 2 protein, partial [Bryobacteraceae bacterium]|nr:glycosyltransferase family 2 protein [Bryobacteraceae bacterium]